MYKKIKNGSFMNWIWFIIATLPFILLIIYSISFLNDKNNNGNILENDINYKNDFLLKNDDGISTFVNNNIEYYTYYESNYDTNTLNIEFDNTNYSTEVFYLDLRNEALNNTKFYVTFVFYDLENNSNIELKFINYHEYEEITMEYGKFYQINGVFDYGGDNIEITLDNIPNNTEFTYKANLKIFFTYEPIYTSSIENWFYIIRNSSYFDFLNDINNTLKTNGFISSAFLNLATLFGVNNVYYSLACYYIEYLLVIVLLHLAFDVLYMLPNICHKFMEKIGGERD